MSKGEEAVKVLGVWYSPFVMRVRISLNIKSVKYNFLEENLGDKSQLLLQSNPVHKKVPVLIHEDKPVCESLIIVEHVDQVWSSAPSILPSHPYDRAIARFWAAYIDHKWYPAFKGIAGAKGEKEIKVLMREVDEGLALLEDAYNNISKGKPFFGGDRIGYLDIAFGCFLGWIRVTETVTGAELISEAKTPGLAKWAKKFWEDDAVRPVMPETEKLVEFFHVVRTKYGGSA
ncbi:glutathione S-transferase U17-like [Neltuma alba]|uniref:glutathione S-transferase U17-like n=1 Tax=Neltuma alba TaxID=207710 RepID=UPI0010A4C9EC|nr:glutathione S-transferase U17-like [Prosopis alba]